MNAPPREDGEELVLADQLMERGDPRGELIIVEAELDVLGIDHPRKGGELAARAARLRPKAHAAWSKALSLGDRFTLELGLPSRVPVGFRARKGAELREHRWIIGYEVRGASEEQLIELLRHPALVRARSLVLCEIDLTEDGLAAICASETARRLERLDLTLSLGPRALSDVLGSASLERLTRLEVGCHPGPEQETRLLERVDGLPALRALHLKRELDVPIVHAVARAPLAQRLEELRMHVLPERLELPRLRRLILAESHPGRYLKALLADEDGPRLPRLAYLDLGGSGVTAAEVLPLIDDARLPALRRLDISRNPIGEDAVAALRKRFGDQLIATNMREPRQKRSAKPRLRQAEKATTALAESGGRKSRGRRRS